MIEVINGYISKIKRGFPYPLARPDGSVWQCKIRVLFEEDEEDGEDETYIYKGYPTNGDPNDWCNLKRGTHVVMTVETKPNSHLRGEILDLKVV